MYIYTMYGVGGWLAIEEGELKAEAIEQEKTTRELRIEPQAVLKGYASCQAAD